MKKLSLSVLVLLIASGSAAFGQARFAGKVIDVVDGKTVIVEDSSQKRFALQLSYIEIPAPEFPIWQTIKDHLQKLVLEKKIEFEVILVEKNTNIAKITKDGTDLSKQMLRDGAAWYQPSRVPAYVNHNSDEYQDLERFARYEKRGLWSLTGVKSSQQLNLEIEEKIAEQERITKERATNDEVEKILKARIKRAEDQRRANASMQIWPNIPGSQNSDLEWDWVGGSKANGFYISKKQIIKNPHGTISVWLKVVPRTDTEAGKQGRQSYIDTLTLSIGRERAEKFSHYLNLREYRCVEREIRDGRIVFYDIDGIVLRQMDALGNWSPSAPESLNEELLKAVCN